MVSAYQQNLLLPQPLLLNLYYAFINWDVKNNIHLNHSLPLQKKKSLMDHQISSFNFPPSVPFGGLKVLSIFQQELKHSLSVISRTNNKNLFLNQVIFIISQQIRSVTFLNMLFPQVNTAYSKEKLQFNNTQIHCFFGFFIGFSQIWNSLCHSH